MHEEADFDVLAEVQHAQAGIDALEASSDETHGDELVDVDMLEASADDVASPPIVQHWHRFEDMQAFMEAHGAANGFKVKHKTKDTEFLPPGIQPITYQQSNNGISCSSDQTII